MNCPYCGHTSQYTDPNLQVRCVNCFNHVAGTATTPIGRNQDDEAAMTIGDHVYPQPLVTKYSRTKR